MLNWKISKIPLNDNPDIVRNSPLRILLVSCLQGNAHLSSSPFTQIH